MQNLIFILMVGAAVGILVMALALPVFGESRQARKRLRRRLRQVATKSGEPESVSLLRERYLKQLSPLERSLESLPGMERIARLLRDAGSQWIAYRYVSMAMALGGAAAVAGWLVTDSGLLALLFGGLALAGPFFKLLSDRVRRLNRFEEQLPDAIDVMRRALQAGHPFSETLHLVATELPDPVAVEFERTFNAINYGGDMRTALVGLLGAHRHGDGAGDLNHGSEGDRRQSGGSSGENQPGDPGPVPLPAPCADPVRRGSHVGLGAGADSLCPVPAAVVHTARLSAGTH